MIGRPPRRKHWARRGRNVQRAFAKTLFITLFVLMAACARPPALPFQSQAPPVTRESVTGPTKVGVRKYIKHIVVIIQENRSFESFFAGYPGADAPMYGCGLSPVKAAAARGSTNSSVTCPPGDKKIALHRITFQREHDLPHEFESALIDWDNGNMDGFTHSTSSGHRAGGAYTYVERTQVAPYWTMAQQYVLADAMFPTEFGPSWTAHLTLVAGTDNLNSSLALADFADQHSDCSAPPGSKTTTVDEYRVVIDDDRGPAFGRDDELVDRDGSRSTRT